MRSVLPLALASFAVAPVAIGQTTVTLMHDNDEWAHTEQEYASGARLSLASADWAKAGWVANVASLLPGAETGDTTSAAIGLGHYFYIPRDIARTDPIPDQRPYAGYLHGWGALIRQNAGHQDTWKMELGVVGPSSRARELETFFHAIFHSRDMKGWDNHITDRLAANISWERRWRNLVPLGAVAVDISPAVGLEAGTVSDAATAGLTLRLGGDLDADFGAPRSLALGGSLSREARDGVSGYLFASLDGRYQAYDVFLDTPGGKAGDHVRAGQGITRSKLRSEGSLGFVVAYRGARLSFAWTEESRRYRQQAERQRFGEVTLGWSF